MEKKFDDIVFYTRRTVDRRKVEGRGSFLKQEYLKHNPERRVANRRQNMEVSLWPEKIRTKSTYNKML